ncbi:MAG: Pr6Pr family membrane protein [Paracoccaceae bacterium]
MPLSLPCRLAAAFIALVAFASVGGQLILNAAKPEHAGFVAAAWHMAQYFTILTNLLVGVVFGAIALSRPPSGGVVAGTLLSIVMVGVVYHVLLAPATPHAGAQWWTDFGFHTVTPIASGLWWLVWGDRDLSLGQVPWWLVWPTGYCAYALVRGIVSGTYPYFFFDIGRFGVPFVAGYIVALVLAFALAGAVIWALARLLNRRRPARTVA